MMEKLSFSCWQHIPFREAVAATSRRQVLLCGIESHVCVFQTALEMNDDGFEVPVLMSELLKVEGDYSFNVNEKKDFNQPDEQSKQQNIVIQN